MAGHTCLQKQEMFGPQNSMFEGLLWQLKSYLYNPSNDSTAKGPSTKNQTCRIGFQLNLRMPLVTQIRSPLQEQQTATCTWAMGCFGVHQTRRVPGDEDPCSAQRLVQPCQQVSVQGKGNTKQGRKGRVPTITFLKPVPTTAVRWQHRVGGKDATYRQSLPEHVPCQASIWSQC